MAKKILTDAEVELEIARLSASECTLHINGHRNMKEVYNINGKCNTLLCDGDGGNRQKKVYQKGRCRKLTPIEYERLQTLPDDYTAGVADSRRYTAIGNGWTVDVIAHILTFLPELKGSEHSGVHTR